ncbi:MAG: bifunctional UDP-sugar hydrolase/5'-nucleotidase [Candidatus Eremiobacteraeota bacterium]|nr:bifunctional UDP-sugar hydrolase/5'-nucleotidase [Candidatus Eremiobacteraeota bacterium]
MNIPEIPASAHPSRPAAGEVRQALKEEPLPSDSFEAASGGPEVKLTILHTNDCHGYVDEHKPEGDEAITGGIARTASEIKKKRAENPEGTITLDGGDFFDGGFYSKYTDGKIVSNAYHEIKPDAIALGNHDLSWGSKKFASLAKEIGSPVVAANLTDLTEEKSLRAVKPYVLVERKGLKIGIVGITSKMTANSSPEKGSVKIEEPLPSIEKYVTMLKNDEKADMVVLLSHLGYDKDREVAESVKGIDVIVGSHSHTAMEKGEKVKDTLIVQAGGEGDYLGEVELVFNREKGTMVSCDARLMPITSKIEADPQVEKILAPYMEKFRPLKEKVLAHTDEDLAMYDERVLPTNLTNLFVDAQKKDADLALSSMFSLRGGIPKGPITLGDLFEVYPFDNELIQVKTNGAGVLGYLETAFRDGYKGNYTLFSGLTLQYDRSLPEGERITTVNYEGRDYPRKDFEKLTLRVNMDNYTHRKSWFKTGTILKKYGKVFDVLKDYLQENKSFKNISAEVRYHPVKDSPGSNGG